MTKGVWRLVGIFLLSTYFTLLYHLMSTISSGIYYIEHFVLDSMVVYNDLVLNFCFCWFCLVCPNYLSFTFSCLSELLFRACPWFCLVSPNCYSFHAPPWLYLYIRIVIPCLSLILSCLSECYSVLLTTFVFSVLIIVHAYPWLSLVDPNCYSMLIPEFFLSLQIAVPCLSLTLSVCPNCYSVHIDVFVLSVRIVIPCISMASIVCPNCYFVLITNIVLSNELVCRAYSRFIFFSNSIMILCLFIRFVNHQWWM